jgi:hypothetical protein
MTMAGWDELRVILARLGAQQPSPLLQWPDPRDEQGQPPPFRIKLVPTASEVAEDLRQRFGDSVVLTVGHLPYPPARQPDRPPDTLTGQLTDELLDPRQARTELDGPATVQSGQTLRHGLLVGNLTGQELAIATNGQVTAVVVDPETGQPVGGFAGAQRLPGVVFRIPPGATERIPLLIGTASFRPDLGYTVPPGSWGIQIPIYLQRGPYARERRLTPVLPLTITA